MQWRRVHTNRAFVLGGGVGKYTLALSVLATTVISVGG